MKVVYGIHILIILADNYYNKGCHINTIMEKYGFTEAELLPVISKLVKVGLIEHDPKNIKKLVLKVSPERNWTSEILPKLKEALKENNPL